jgi:hypothetical protein
VKRVSCTRDTLTIREGDAVGTDVDRYLREEPNASGEECGCSASRRVLPHVNDVERRPKDLAIDLLSRRSGDDAEDADDALEEWDHWQLPDLTAGLLRKPREVRYTARPSADALLPSYAPHYALDSQGAKAACDRSHTAEPQPSSF